MNYEVMQIIADNFAEIEQVYLHGKKLAPVSSTEKSLQDEILALREHLAIIKAEKEERRTLNNALIEDYKFVRDILEILTKHSKVPEEVRKEISKGLSQTKPAWSHQYVMED